MKRSHAIFLQDIFEAIGKIDEFVGKRSFEEFCSDEVLLNAVVHKIEIIGEAAKGVPSEVRARHPKIPWAEMSKTRDKLIHSYFGVDNEIIWKIVKEELPPLKSIIAEAAKAEAAREQKEKNKTA